VFELLAQADVFGVTFERVIKRGLVSGWRFLLNVRDDPCGRYRKIARVLVQFAANQREQSGFADTVRTRDPDILTGMDAEGSGF